MELDPDRVDRSWRSANVHVTYPGEFVQQLGEVFRPFVLLEVGNAWVTPFVERPITSFIHDHLHAIAAHAEFVDNRVERLRCVHPLVTLLEKLDALHRRVLNEQMEPASFVRHFEDAAHIIQNLQLLPFLNGYTDARSIAVEMLAGQPKQIRQMPTAGDPAFQPDRSQRWQAIRQAWRAIAPMFWGPRIELDEACAVMRQWIRDELG